jgi:DNA-binding NarL/FixJ family response regulator
MKHRRTKIMDSNPISVSVVEDDAGIRAGLVRLLGLSPEFECAGAYASAEAALKAFAVTPPTVVLMDLNLPGMNGVECSRKLKELSPEAHIIMLTVYDNPDQIFEALKAGATGYLVKQTPPDELLAAVRDVCRGGAPMSAQIARKVVQSFREETQVDELAKLSAREREVLDRLAQGYLLKEIADQLDLNYHTVKTYVGRIYEKLHVHSRAQAMMKCRQMTASTR